MEKSAGSKRFAFMDALNVVAIFAVVLLHCSLNIFDNGGDTAWNVALVFQCVAIFAVPVFFMVSGANLLGYRERYSTGTFFRKRALRVVVTLVVWSAVFYLLLCFCSGLFGYEPRNFSPVIFVKELLTCNVVNIYWFFYVIIGLYLVTPVFSLVAADKRVLGYTIILAAVLSFLVPLAAAFRPEETEMLVGIYAMDFFTWALTYYLVGYYLTHYVERRFNTALLVAVCAVCVALMIGLTWVMNAGHAGEYNNVFAKAEGILTLVYAPALFLLFKQGEEKIAGWRGYGTVRKLAAMSLTVYAVHLIFVWIFDAHVLTAVTANSAAALVLQFVAEPLVVYGLALAVAWCVEAGKRAWKNRKKSAA